MKKPPPEIDALMWSVAEMGDESAIAEFGDRYPDLRTELAARLAMVRQLKGAKPIEARNSIPIFVPSHVASPSFHFPRWAWVPTTVFLGVVAYASYSLALSNLPQQRPSESVQPGVVRLKPAERQANPPIISQQIPSVPREGDVAPIVNNQAADHVAPTDKVLTLRFERISLHAALDAIGQQSGVRIEVAPGLEDFDISMRYGGLSTLKVLEDMGRNFGFSVFPESENSVLVIPAVDRAKQEGGVVEPAVPQLLPSMPQPGRPNSGDGPQSDTVKRNSN